MGILKKGERRPLARSEQWIDRAVSDIEHGRFERSLSGLTAFAAAVTTAEISLEHYRARWISPIRSPAPGRKRCALTARC